MGYAILIIIYLKENRTGGGRLRGHYGYPCLKNMLEFWPRYWVEHLFTINGIIDERNKFELKSGKNWVVKTF